MELTLRQEYFLFIIILVLSAIITNRSIKLLLEDIRDLKNARSYIKLNSFVVGYGIAEDIYSDKVNDKYIVNYSLNKDDMTNIIISKESWYIPRIGEKETVYMDKQGRYSFNAEDSRKRILGRIIFYIVIIITVTLACIITPALVC